MELIEYNKLLKLDGEIVFSLNELDKWIKTPKDITIMVLVNLLKNNNISDGVYLLSESSYKFSNGRYWQRIIVFHNNLRFNQLYSAEILDVLLG